MPIVFENEIDRKRLKNCIEFAEATYSHIIEWQKVIYEAAPKREIAQQLALMPFQCLSVCFDHFGASIDAIKNGNTNTPGALLRCTLEAYCRGVWLFYVKDKQLLKNFMDSKDTKDPEKLIRELRQTDAPKELCDGLSAAYISSKKALNTLVHNGFESIHWQAEYIGADVSTACDILAYLIQTCLEALAAMVLSTRLDERNPELASKIITWKLRTSNIGELLNNAHWKKEPPNRF